MALKLSAMEESRSPGAWCTARPVGRPQQTIRHAYIIFLKKLFEEKERAAKGMDDRR
jgi:hypothetical protein